MNTVFAAHSGLRFLILLAGVVALVICLTQKPPFSKAARISCAAYLGLMHLQVVMGLAMVAMGTWYPKLIGHLVLMLVAAIGAQVLVSRNRRSAVPGYRLPLIAVGGSLLLILAGIMAIRSSPFFMTHVG